MYTHTHLPEVGKKKRKAKLQDQGVGIDGCVWEGDGAIRSVT